MAKSTTRKPGECSHGHQAPPDVIKELPDSQEQPGRHKCPVCAWEIGFQAGIEEARRRAREKGEDEK